MERNTRTNKGICITERQVQCEKKKNVTPQRDWTTHSFVSEYKSTVSFYNKLTSYTETVVTFPVLIVLYSLNDR